MSPTPPPEPTTSLVAWAKLDPDDLAHCAALLRAGSKSFSAAARLLPARIRPSATVVYAWCRVADDAVDESGDPDAAVAMLRRRLDATWSEAPLGDPVDRALRSVVRRHDLPRAPFDALVEGFAWDAGARDYATIDDVLAYAARVASAVGVIMTYVMGPRSPATLARACDLGAAMQLTNIARDVGEDARRGRLYLPRAWLCDEGLDPDAWLADPKPHRAIARVVERMLAAAEPLYARGIAGVADLPADCRAAIRGAALVYADIGRVIRRAGCDSVTRRAYTSAPRKLWLLLRAWLGRPEAMSTAHDRGAPPLPQTAFLVGA